MLAPASYRDKLSRRAFLRAGTATAGFALIATACGNSDSTDTTSGGGGGGTVPDWLEYDATATGDWSRKYAQPGGNIAMFTWGDYNDPEIIGALAESSLGVVMTVDYYDDNSGLIQRLASASGSSGFDIIAPTGPYIPQMIERGLIQKFNKDLLPNIVNVDPVYLGQAWDPGNEYSVCKDWGSTGFIYDSSKINRELTTWGDFLDACENEFSGNCSVLDTAPNFVGPYFWKDDKSWNTTSAADFEAARAYLVDTLAPNIKDFDSYPSTALAEGAFGMSMAFNGDARQAYNRIAEVGGDPEPWKWVLGAPRTELWMDNYCIPVGAPNVEGAHAWINWLLIPEISIQDLVYHGYHSGMKTIDKLISELAPDLERPDMIFFTDEQVETMETQVLSDTATTIEEILAEAKAKAGG
jgi:spermidine/putrescine transport system substrate-binding protein